MKSLIAETFERPIVADIPMPTIKDTEVPIKFAPSVAQCGISAKGTNWYNSSQFGTGVPFAVYCSTNQIVQLPDESYSSAAISIAIGCSVRARADRLRFETFQFLGTPPA